MKVSVSKIQAAWLGTVPYRQAWRWQAQLAAAIATGERPASLLLLEHPHTFTLGRSGTWDHLLWGEQKLQAKGVEAIAVDRGGDITYHGPGQLVAYPLLPLGQVDANGHLPGPDYHGFLRRLERTIVQTLQTWGLKAGPMAGLTGVWLNHQPSESNSGAEPAKIAAIGVKVDANGISQHGAALNVSPDMSYWRGIIPCGISQYPVTSMTQELSPAPTMSMVRRQFMHQFKEVFDCEIDEIEAEQLLASLPTEADAA